MGVCAEFPDVYIVSEYCAKGSLQVLGCIFKSKEALNLFIVFRHSFNMSNLVHL